MMKLDELGERLPAELSAGQKQRVALARSLVLEPKLLLLDEPLGDMDYKLQKRMERELLRLHRDLDTTFVYVTHDQTQAMRLADQVIVMNDGRIEQSDTVETVYNSPATAFVAAFVGDSNLFRGTVEAAAADQVTIDTAYGSILAGTDNLDSPPAQLRGERLTFSVRPQHLSFSETTDNTLSCTVLDVLYRPGAGTQVILDATASDGSTKELQLRTWDPAPIEAGEDVTVGWNAADTILLERASVVEGIDLETTILGE